MLQAELGKSGTAVLSMISAFSPAQAESAHLNQHFANNKLSITAQFSSSPAQPRIITNRVANERNDVGADRHDGSDIRPRRQRSGKIIEGLVVVHRSSPAADALRRHEAEYRRLRIEYERN